MGEKCIRKQGRVIEGYITRKEEGRKSLKWRKRKERGKEGRKRRKLGKPG